jgi:predicted nucleic acid-binding Zn ribbon protein
LGDIGTPFITFPIFEGSILNPTHTAMPNYYCKYCGTKATNVQNLTAGYCQRHPDGASRGKHALYEGDEKPQYTCKYCGTKAPSISNLTAGACQRHPAGAAKGKHAPAL